MSMNISRQAVIIASRPVSAGMLSFIEEGAFVITADAGWQTAEKLELTVDLAVGDWDSSSLPTIAKKVASLPQQKDDTDTLFAAKMAVEQGYTHILILGATGGRADHMFANMQVLLYLAKQNVFAVMADENSMLYCMAPGKLELMAENWRWLSVFAAGGSTEGVCLSGVKYPLNNAVLTPDFPIGISNEFCEDVASISCKKGFLYVWLQANEENTGAEN